MTTVIAFDVNFSAAQKAALRMLAERAARQIVATDVR